MRPIGALHGNLILFPARDRHLFAPREPGRILVELDNQPRLIVFDISALRFRPPEILELHDLLFRCAEFFQSFQLRANFFRDAPAFGVSGRDDEGGLVILDCLQIIGGEHRVAFIGGDFQDRAELFQIGEAPLDVAMTQGVDGFPIRGVALAANLFYTPRPAKRRDVPATGARRPVRRRYVARCRRRE